MKVLVWNFRWLLKGVHPETDPDGRDWGPGARKDKAGKPIMPCVVQGLLTMFRPFVYLLGGDMEHHANETGLNHFGSNEPCFGCPVNRSTLPYNNLQLLAPWKPPVYRPPQGLARPSDHECWNLPSTSRHNAVFDPMHVVDGGVGEHVAGNVFFTCVYNTALLGNDIEV